MFPCHGEKTSGPIGLAEAIVTSAKISFHWKKILFEVKMVEPFSWCLAMSIVRMKKPVETFL